MPAKATACATPSAVGSNELEPPFVGVSSACIAEFGAFTTGVDGRAVAAVPKSRNFTAWGQQSCSWGASTWLESLGRGVCCCPI
eukprot:scaffold303448_cov35-Tisochrysis_lutea.AAC.2